MTDKPYKEMTFEELIERMRLCSAVDNVLYPELRAEMDRKLALVQMKANQSQIKTARYQLLAVIAMFLTALATALAPIWLQP